MLTAMTGRVVAWLQYAVVALAATVGFGAGAAHALSLATDPVLRIETGGHTALALGLAPSADGSHVATASTDRTVRIWSLPKLELERTIYLPAGSDLQGAANTAAFSPDGKTLATGGWIGSWGRDDGPWCVYILDVGAADIRQALCDLPQRVHHMTYSPDGAFFLVSLKDAGGLRVYRTSDYSLVAEDKDYADVATWVDVDAAGRVVTCALDGKVRLYDKDFKRIAITTMPEDRKPITVSFAPDGTRIAVGYAEPEGNDPLWPPAVDVLNATDLTVAYRPDTRGIDNGTLWRLAWSADGKFLYAGGTWQKASRYPIRRWADGGRGRPLDIAAANNRIVRIRTLPSGGVVYVTEVPYMGVIGANDRVVAERKITTADYTDLTDKLAVSRDGLHVQFAFEPNGARPANFSFTKRQLEDGEAPADAKLDPPITDDPALDVRDWSWSYRPTLNGQPLAIRAHDQALTMAIAPDKKSFLIGTSWEIIRYDAAGKVLWSTPVFMYTRGLVVSADNRLVVAAIGDGTLRWYAMDTGKELLAFFPHADGQRWVAWTPSGYYMASVGGDTLIGWQVNRGRDHAADFFSVGRFSDKYYRPDIVLKTLAGLDEATAIKEANAEGGRAEQRRSVAQLLPPVIELIDPPRAIDNAEITLKYRVRAPSGEPIEEITVRNDGHALGHYDSPILDNHGEAEGELQLIVPQRDSELLVFARNRFATSEPARIRLVWAGDKTAAANEPQRTLYLLAIGVSQYKDPKLQLGFAAKDANDFVEAVQRQTGKAFGKVVPRILTDDKANLQGIRDGLAWLGKSAGRDDIGVIFLAGHGFDDRDGTYYYLPHEAEVPRLSETALPYGDLLAGLKSIAGHAMLFIDTCHAGDVIGRPGKASMDVIGLVSRLGQPSNGVIVYASSTGDQYSMEASIWRNGAFTKAVVEGLDGAAEYRKRSYITTSMLETYVKERVKDLTANRQTPTVNMPLAVPDLLIARIGGG